VSKIAEFTSRHIASLKDAHRRYIEAADARAESKLARAQTGAERDRIRTNLKIEKMKAKKELMEAQTAAMKAKAALKRAKREAGDIGMGERFAKGAARLQKAVAPSRKKSKKGTGIGAYFERHRKSLMDW